MPAGFKYNLTPEVEMEERYDVQTGIRRRGPFVLDTTNIPAGAKLPSFAPMAADLKYHKVKLVRNFKVVEALAAAGTSLKVAKGCFPYAGMTIGNGSFVSAVSAIDQSTPVMTSSPSPLPASPSPRARRFSRPSPTSPR